MSILPHPSDRDAARLPVRGSADLLAREIVSLDERFAGIDSTLDVFRLAAAAWPERPALTFVPDGSAQASPVDISYARLHERIVRTANHLASLGLQRDDCVAYLLPNLPEAHYCIWGAQAVCRVAAVNHFLEPAQITELLKAMDAKVVITASAAEAPELWAKIAPVLAALPGLRETLVVGWWSTAGCWARCSTSGPAT
jgi:fatty-acyl-CoA synthase